MNHPQVDLAAMARQEMLEHGFEPDLPAAPWSRPQAARQKGPSGLGAT